MQIRLLLGPAGSGKTFRCLAEAREGLEASPEGPPLLLVAPKQSTFQLERLLLEHPALPGYTRLHILSFERLAHFLFEELRQSAPNLLDEDGRVMVLRGLLAARRDDLRLFRASARLAGFAQQLSRELRELQRNQLTPTTLRQAAEAVCDVGGLSLKLQDLATLLELYQGWLKAHELHDADSLLDTAAEALGVGAPSHLGSPWFQVERLWVDGFAEMAPQEQELLVRLAPRCGAATITFCLESASPPRAGWLSSWSAVRKSFDRLRARLSEVPGAEVAIEVLSRGTARSRFTASPTLGGLEQRFGGPLPGQMEAEAQRTSAPGNSLLLATVSSPEAEVTLAAREVVRFVRAGGRYREVTVLVRDLEAYHLPLQRVFARYEIPLFLDRREPMSHHPLAELTRSALRTVAYDWQREDWFAALKTGLVPAHEDELDQLENEALARGWEGPAWHRPMGSAKEPELASWIAGLQERLMPPFRELALALGGRQGRCTGPELAAAIRALWHVLKVEEQLRDWATLGQTSVDSPVPASVHATVWEQMNAWADNVELGFAQEALALREWLPVLEAGLATLTVGVIPPALDQVLAGAVDRSRNPESALVLLLGLNEGVFPARPQSGVLLTDSDRNELDGRDLLHCETPRQHLSREWHYAYVACTRATRRLVLTCASQNAEGAGLNPSPFFSHVRQFFPAAARAPVQPEQHQEDSVHPCELTVPLLRLRAAAADEANPGGQLQDGRLPTALVERLYGRVLRSSISRIEEYAACPFQFLVKSGLRAEERKRFELDVKEQGTFQHDILALFHEQLATEGLKWRDVTPDEARQRIGSIGAALATTYGEGLLQATEQTRFLARMMTASLQDFVATLVTWMREQYRFEPSLVEWSFGLDGPVPAWSVELDAGHRLELKGRIDRVDVWRPSGSSEGWCVVVDYKSGQKRLDSLLVRHGVQLQLLTYLNVLRHWAGAKEALGVDKLNPAGAFYVTLYGMYCSETDRQAALSNLDQARKLAYRHTGRFDRGALPQLDARPGVTEGDQFNFRITKSGEFHKRSPEALPTEDFLALLDSTGENLRRMGREIFAGRVDVDPYRRGTATACDNCGFAPVCRIDTWTHHFRVLRPPATANPEPGPATPVRAAAPPPP